MLASRELEAWKLTGQPVDHGRDQSRRHNLSASDPHLSRHRIGQEFDFFDALSEVVEDGRTPLQQGAAIECRLDAVRRPIEETDAEGGPDRP